MATDTLNPTPVNPRDWLYPTPRGLYCAPGDFYIDPAVAVPRAVITHGHGDHARPGHRSALATPETLAIMRARFQDMPDTQQQALKYGDAVGIGDPIAVRLDETPVTGRFADLAEDGALIIETAEGARRIIAGDLVLAPA